VGSSQSEGGLGKGHAPPPPQRTVPGGHRGPPQSRPPPPTPHAPGWEALRRHLSRYLGLKLQGMAHHPEGECVSTAHQPQGGPPARAAQVNAMHQGTGKQDACLTAATFLKGNLHQSWSRRPGEAGSSATGTHLAPWLFSGQRHRSEQRAQAAPAPPPRMLPAPRSQQVLHHKPQARQGRRGAAQGTKKVLPPARGDLPRAQGSSSVKGVRGWGLCGSGAISCRGLRVSLEGARLECSPRHRHT